MTPVRTALLRRFRTMPQDGARTLYFKLEVGRLGRFLDPNDVPDFEGDVAVFEYEKVRGRIRLLRKIE